MAAVCAAVLGISALVGCGGGGSSSTKSDFIAEASSICKQASEERTAALEKAASENEGKSLNTKEETALAGEILLPVLQNLVGELASLDIPDENGKELRAAVQAFEKGLADAESDHAKLLEAATFTPARKRAKEAGFPECSQF